MTETQHVIALNPYRKGNKGKVFSNSMAVYDKVIASPEIRKMIQQIIFIDIYGLNKEIMPTMQRR